MTLLVLLVCGCTGSQRASQAPPAGSPAAALAAATKGPLALVEDRFRARRAADVSGFSLLDSNRDGLRWRMALIDAAQRSLDFQYYMWLGDTSGKLLLERVLAAADRGVKVRILVDDLSTMLEDETHLTLRDHVAAVIDGHPNVEIRLFNAWRSRSLLGRVLESAGDAERANQRMHNKLMIADNHAAIIGGRNIGDHYFGLATSFNFRDLDVLGIGPVSRQASGVFDRFWNSAWVVPVAALDIAVTPGQMERLRAALPGGSAADGELAESWLDATDWSAAFADLPRSLHAGTSVVHTDSADTDEVAHHMPVAIRALLATAREQVLITNAYVIPGAHAIERIREQVAAGVDYRILTNSLASHDVPAVNSHYKVWRPRLLAAGVQLYEVRPDAAVHSLLADTPPVRSDFMGLHAKAMVIDRQRVFVGSLNLDPRSWAINSEMGVVIESPALAQVLAEVMMRDMLPENAWRVIRRDDGELQWTAGAEVHASQPARDFWQRIEDVIFMAFPADLY
ncbi:MAG: phospholipase D family protein [Gammaproteobacteria bacterium]